MSDGAHMVFAAGLVGMPVISVSMIHACAGKETKKASNGGSGCL